ncbi:penicillin-binding protein [Patescibacteria group bacterium]|nr:penicillin-binding protein [Patescibacteria group bacterium]
MATKRKYKILKKNKSKQEKNVLVVNQPVKKLKEIKRGRPKLAFHIKCKRTVKKYFLSIDKKINKSIKKLNYQYISILKFLKIKKGRGRKKLAFYIKWQRLVLDNHETFLKNKNRFIKKYHFRKQQVLKFFHLNKRVGRPKNRALHFTYFFSILLTILFLAFTYFSYDIAIKDLPSPTDLSNKEQNVTTRILDRDGNLLYRIYEDENRTLVSLPMVSQYLKDATVAIEDQQFYKHFGFSFKGIFRALLKNFSGETVQGGSTITQQLIKNRLLNNEKTYRRKIRELLLSLIAERIYSKDQILEMYLNTVAYGGSTYGIEEASWRYFNKSSANLSLGEAALLAGLPQAPSTYTPFGSNPELAYTRQAEVLRRMVEDGYISQLQADQAKQEKLVFNQDRIDIQAPHFVMYVRKLLAEKYGEDVLSKGGLEVRTTLDLSLQNQAQTIVSNEISKLTSFQISNGAALVTNPKTGEILAMVGGADYYDFIHDGQVNVTIRPRQPGSSIKPLTYATAFEQGKTAASTIEDSPVIYQIPGSKPYAPKNYDGKFHGKVTLRDALASSYNIPAVKLLAELGVKNLIDKGEALGISTWQDRSRFGLSLTLGAGEVLMTDMAQLYSSFANLGYPVSVNPFLEISNYKGEILYRNSCALDSDNCYEDLELSPKAAYLVTDILSDNKARSAAFGAFSVLNIPLQQVAVKTGTTNSMKDNWTIGYISDRLVATWVGNNDNRPMSYVASGITGASPIWNKIMLLLLDDKNPHKFAVPENMIKVKICASTGTLPCSACPRISEEIFVKGTEPQKACNDQYFIDLKTAENSVGQVL